MTKEQLEEVVRLAANTNAPMTQIADVEDELRHLDSDGCQCKRCARGEAIAAVARFAAQVPPSAEVALGLSFIGVPDAATAILRGALKTAEEALEHIGEIGCMQLQSEPECFCKHDGSAHSIYCPKGIADEALAAIRAARDGSK